MTEFNVLTDQKIFTAQDLDALPVAAGFRLRGAEMSLVLIFVVLIYVYPLKAIYSGALQFFSGGYLESYFTMQSAEDLRSMFIIFGSAYAALSFVILLLNRHALKVRDVLQLNDLEVFSTVTEIQHWQINMAIPVVSIILATLLPDAFLVAAGLIYSLFGVAVPWHFRYRAKLRSD